MYVYIVYVIGRRTQPLVVSLLCREPFPITLNTRCTHNMQLCVRVITLYGVHVHVRMMPVHCTSCTYFVSIGTTEGPISEPSSSLQHDQLPVLHPLLLRELQESSHDDQERLWEPKTWWLLHWHHRRLNWSDVRQLHVISGLNLMHVHTSVWCVRIRYH